MAMMGFTHLLMIWNGEDCVGRGEGGRERVNGWCVDVFQMLMWHFRTKEKVSERKVRKKFRTVKQITSATSVFVVLDVKRCQLFSTHNQSLHIKPATASIYSGFIRLFCLWKQLRAVAKNSGKLWVVGRIQVIILCRFINTSVTLFSRARRTTSHPKPSHLCVCCVLSGHFYRTLVWNGGTLKAREAETDKRMLWKPNLSLSFSLSLFRPGFFSLRLSFCEWRLKLDAISRVSSQSLDTADMLSERCECTSWHRDFSVKQCLSTTLQNMSQLYITTTWKPLCVYPWVQRLCSVTVHVFDICVNVFVLCVSGFVHWNSKCLSLPLFSQVRRKSRPMAIFHLSPTYFLISPGTDAPLCPLALLL